MAGDLADFKDAMGIAMGKLEAKAAQEMDRDAPADPGAVILDADVQIQNQADKVAICIHNYLAALSQGLDEFGSTEDVVRGCVRSPLPEWTPE